MVEDLDDGQLAVSVFRPQAVTTRSRVDVPAEQVAALAVALTAYACEVLGVDELRGPGAAR